MGISQDLTKPRAKLAYLVRNVVRAGQISKTSVRDGKIFVTDNSERKHVITTEFELHSIITDSGVQGETSASVNSLGNTMTNAGAMFTQTNSSMMMMPPGYHVRSPMNNN